MLVHGDIIAVQGHFLGDCPGHSREGPWLLVGLVRSHLLIVLAFDGSGSGVERFNDESYVNDGAELVILVMLLCQADMLELELQRVWSFMCLFAFRSVNNGDLSGCAKIRVISAFVRARREHLLAIGVEQSEFDKDARFCSVNKEANYRRLRNHELNIAVFGLLLILEKTEALCPIDDAIRTLRRIFLSMIGALLK